MTSTSSFPSGVHLLPKARSTRAISYQAARYRRRWRLLSMFVLSTSLLTGCASLVRPNYTQSFEELRAGDYKLDPDHAYLLFRIEHLGLSTVVGRFNDMEASLDFDPSEPEALTLEGRVSMDSIDLGNETLEGRLRGRDWLDTERFPQARFVTTEVGIDDDGVLSIIGDFTLHGVTRPLTLAAMFNGGADNLLTGKYTLGFSATGALERSDYGIDAFAALVGDEIGVEIHGEFQKR